MRQFNKQNFFVLLAIGSTLSLAASAAQRRCGEIHFIEDEVETSVKVPVITRSYRLADGSLTHSSREVVPLNREVDAFLMSQADGASICVEGTGPSISFGKFLAFDASKQ